MTKSEPATGYKSFLIVDEFLSSFIGTRALKTAFELGLIDRLAARKSGSVDALARAIGIDPPGAALLFGLLRANGVIQTGRGNVRFTARFEAALKFRDLLELKMDYAGFAVTDFADHLTSMVRDEAQYMRDAAVFRMYDYEKCLTPSRENYFHTRRWMQITSTLTRYEAAAVFAHYDLSRHRSLLDVGGHSGEFSLQCCTENPNLQATVFDLPLVCEIGLEHTLNHPAGPRVAFQPGDLRAELLPVGHDLISFKSVLHDWPLDDVRRFLKKAVGALEIGGTLMIFERLAFDFGKQTPPFALLPAMLFARSYRYAEDYVSILQTLGLTDIQVTSVPLDSEYCLITAVVRAD